MKESSHHLLPWQLNWLRRRREEWREGDGQGGEEDWMKCGMFQNKPKTQDRRIRPLEIKENRINYIFICCSYVSLEN